jgi:glutamyl-tRNA reductase
MHFIHPSYVTYQKNSYRVGVLGLNFKTASLELREKISRIASKMEEEEKLMQTYAIIPLSTCNRTEIYFSYPDLDQAKQKLLEFFESHTEEMLEESIYTYFGIDAFTHLCTVTAGLDSAILAETEIQRQVKIAYTRTAQKIKLPSISHFFFQKALHIAKLARNKIAIEKGAPTLYGTIWKMAEEKLGDLTKIPILLIGYSEINRGFISFLFRKKITNFTLITQNPFQPQLSHGKIYGRDFLPNWRSFPLILCATKADRYLITGDGTSSQLIFDLSVPRIVKPTIQHVELWNMERLHQKMKTLRSQEAHPPCNCRDWIAMKAEHLLKFGRARESWERDHITDVFHAGCK